MWSTGSVGPAGRFFRDEATWALERGTYLPVLIDEVRLPLGFGEVHALSLARLKEVFGDAASVQQAEINAQLGNRSAAYAALARGLEVKDGGIQQIAADPWLDPLRPESQFQALLQRLAVPI